MTSDRERRDVARRLREIEQGVIGALIPTGELAENILRAIGYGHSGAMTPYGRLADLIEPESERTCRNLNPPSCRDFECSECGESSEFTPGFMPNYCPHCGARVVGCDDA